MKKNLIALAIFGAFSGAALAQSNVTLYGIIDVNFQYNDPDTGSSTRGINSGHQSGSRFGFRGSETLATGLNAVFTIEGGFNPDLGTSGQGGRLFGRQVWGGFSGGWGTAVLGRVATFSSGTGSFDMFGNTDPFLTGFGDSALASTFTSAGATRLDNSFLYSSPTFGGFKFGAGYSFNGNGTELAGSGANNRIQFYGVNFSRGPIFAVVTYDRFDVPDGGVAGSATAPRIAANASDQWNLQAGLTFDLKFIKLHGGYAKEDRVYYTSGLGLQFDPGADADAWMGGVTLPLGPKGGTLLGSYQRRNGDNATVCLNASTTIVCPAANVQTRNRDVRVWAIGYTYPFSRRTNLYVNFSDLDNEQRTVTFTATGAVATNTTAEAGRKQYTVGIRHLF
ncbi:MAG: porin [Burkholderiaceae bacterium]